MRELLCRMAALLRLGNIPEWAAVLEQSADKLGAGAAGAETFLRDGGAAFLPGLVLRAPGRILLDENREYARLCAALHALCRARWPARYRAEPEAPACFADLMPYPAETPAFPCPGVVHVGWVDVLGEYPVGEVTAGTLEKLARAASGNGVFQPLVEPLRFGPVCRACGELDFPNGDGGFLLDAELWIPTDGMIYVAPLAILHYIAVHRYLPPRQYLDAIDVLDTQIAFDGAAVHFAKLEESGWFARKLT